LTVFAILGIVFGGLGTLCVGLTDLMAVFSLFNPAMSQFAAGQSQAQRIVGLLLGLCGLGLSILLLAGSIGSLNLKPQARQLMVGWAIADILFDAARLLITVLFLMPDLTQNPAFATNPAFAHNPNPQQFMHFARVFGIAGATVAWALTTTFAVLIYVFFRKPEIIAAFDGLPQNLGVGLPIPPPPPPV
jgi:hypothetical protein